jgi:hypothetical protein
MPEVGAQRDRLPQSLQALGFDRRPVRCQRGVGDAQDAGLGGGLPQERPRRWRRIVGLAGARPRVLEEEGDTAERAIGQPVGDGPAGVVIELQDHGVDARVARLDALDGRLQQRLRRDLAAPHEVGEAHRVVPLVVGEPAHAEILAGCSAAG